MTETSIELRVRYAEIAGDHAYYANYLGWIEACMGKFYRDCKLPFLGFEHTGIRTMVAEAFCKFIRPARYDDLLRITMRFTAAAPKRAKFEHEIRRGDELLAEARTTHVLAVDGKDGLQPFPEDVLALAGTREERVGVLDKPGELSPEPQSVFRNASTFPVRYRETDAVGIVYFSNYLVYFEVGRTELLRAAGLSFTDLKAGGVRMPVARAYCKFLAPLAYGDDVTVKTWIPAVRKVQLAFRYELTRAADGAPVASGFTVHGCLDAAGRPMRVPEPIEKLAAARQAG